jgi:hypothetical protein
VGLPDYESYMIAERRLYGETEFGSLEWAKRSKKQKPRPGCIPDAAEQSF